MTHRAEINITPLIDILLVLLVIFLAALPLTEVGIDANVPPTRPVEAMARPNDIVLEYAANGDVSINHERVALVRLQARLRELYADRSDKTMFVLGDGRLRYGRIIEVLDAAKGAGVDRVGIITENEVRKNAQKVR